uniref:Eukaryotic translation initiation factor 4B n=1 Tax=Rhinopithecus roxellana TaxID=61622 RepID=A0A2K6P5U3_RHIRO
TISLTDFLAEDGSAGGGSTYVSKPVTPPTDRSILPTAPPAAREPSIDRSRLPKSPPNTAFLGNLPYDVIEESVKEFFRGLNISAVRLPREPSNPERLKGLAYAAFEDLDFLLSALSLSEESLGNRRIRVDVADQAQDKDRDDHSFGRDGNRDSDKTDTDWRARSATDSFDDYSPRRGDDSFGDKNGTVEDRK